MSKSWTTTDEEARVEDERNEAGASGGIQTGGPDTQRALHRESVQL